MENEPAAAKPHRKIAVLGRAPSSLPLAPDDDESWEIWILNTAGILKEVKRWDRHYELHDLERTKDPSYGNYYSWMQDQSQTKAIYLRDAPPDEFGPEARQYPLAEILKELDFLRGLKYLTNTISMMLAHVVLEQVQQKNIAEFGLWGVDMAQHGLKNGHAGWFTSEYAKQRPSCEYWIGILEGMGLQCTIPHESDLMRTPCIYGYHHTEHFKKWEARRKELAQRIAAAQNVEAQKHDEAVYLQGALEAMNYHDQSQPFEEASSPQ